MQTQDAITAAGGRRLERSASHTRRLAHARAGRARVRRAPRAGQRAGGRPRAPRGRRRPVFPISGYDDLTAAQVTSGSANWRRPSCARCATTSAQRKPQVGPAAIEQARLSGAPAILGGWPLHHPRPPPPRRRARAHRRRLAYGGNGVARRDDGYVVFVAGAMPGDRVRARSPRPSAPTPRRAPSRCSSRRPSGSRRRRPSRRAVAGAALRAPARGQAGAGRRRAARIGKLDGFELEPIVPAVEQWRYRNKLEYSFGTDDDGELVFGFHAPGRWDRIVPMTTACSPPSAATSVREQVLAWCREQGLAAWDRRTQQGFLRNLVVREGRRTGQFQVRLVTSPGELDADALLDARRLRRPALDPDRGLGETTQGGETSCSPAARSSRSSSATCASGSPRGVLPDEHRDGRAALRLAGEFAALRGSERVFDLYCGIGTIGLTIAARAREVVGVEIVEPRGRRRDRERAPQRDRQRALLRRRRAPRAARARRARPAARRRRRRPAARRPLAEGRAPHDRGAPAADRLRLLQPDDARAERRAARRGRLRRSSACARSTCSRRRRTSSASRCWSAPSSASRSSHCGSPPPARRRPARSRRASGPRRA